MDIEYKVNEPLPLNEMIAIYKKNNFEKSLNNSRLIKMNENTQLTVSAWNGTSLVGFARCLTDFEYSCYLSEIVVLPEFHSNHIGTNLLEKVQEYVGNRVTISLRSDPNAIEFYKKLGLKKINNMFRIHREG
ncbi:GNAT family N-acetyltransferase [Lentilactobacillus sp. Marseille-Q4993]|uniref:GNAT family N-acetyltransferase n=1 Tax=Lentilactobacillus sp. Marseille-Q4993 TaxID=3039492 RepID=UPI0024BC202A|nr:GNAT family N-acetyltransferase [Lentilactobacillus sp. Marseille-Q4993]